MISAREFCREQDYSVAVFLTYSFDPLFFERVPLRDLEKGGSRRILVVADAGQVQQAMRQSLGQLAYLGRRYVLAEAVSSQTFHPKLIARLSPTGGRVWVGSGNLTYGGWGGNRELATAWPIGPCEEDNGLWLAPLFDAVAGYLKSSAFETHLEAVYGNVPWLKSSSPPDSVSHVFFSTPDRPLAPQLAARWQNRKFDEVNICTGSTDTDGAFLLWAYRTFGIKRATICVSPAFASFEPARLKKLPIEVRIIKANPEQLMHAKFYWFSGKDGNAAVVGSANCSAAAWLAGNGAGNFELVVPYDAPSKADFKSILAVFNGPKLSPDKALSSRPLESRELENEESVAFRIVSLRLRATGRIVEAILDPPPLADSRIVLVIEGSNKQITIPMVHQTKWLTGRLPPDFEIGPGTAFATAIIEQGGEKTLTAPHWIDNEAALTRASSGSLLDPGLRDLSRQSVMSSDQQKILEAVYAVSHALLRGDCSATALAKDVRMLESKPGEKEADEPAKVDAVDPAAILRSLRELKAQRDARGNSQYTPYGGTLNGVMALLFSREKEEEEIDLSREAWVGDNPEQATDEPGEVKGNLGSNPPPQMPPTFETAAETAQKFYDQIDSFLCELGSHQFAEHCDAERLVQALAFPLLVCVRGNEGGWLPAAALASISTRVVQIMFVNTYEPNKTKGLLRFVKDRYTGLQRQDEFLHAVGEGTLWSALLAGLSAIYNALPTHFVPQASALVEVFSCKDLVSFASPEHLSCLIQTLVIPNAEIALTEKANGIAHALAELEKILLQKEEEICKQQGNGRRLQNGGSLMWSSKWGWDVLALAPAQAYCYGFINVQLAAQTDPEIEQSLNRLRETML